ncbi:uncharacterized protein LOC118757371 [Rhagoletis pomonella]|uniref:uncharacterized protein LOC118757371 n=1 Tax=Rhagoletis pomonella TaxID=28610 RepID=UPI00178387E7|nr:uncharacterized protein LOC118757371 [Rhagoletis pomonella]
MEKSKRAFLMKILNIEITQTNINIKLTKDLLNQAQQQLKCNLNESEFNTFVNKQSFLGQRIAEKKRSTLNSKTDKLKYEQVQKLGIKTDNNWFVNNTSIKFPDDVKWILSLGRKFTLPTTKSNFSPLHIIAEMEQLIQSLENEREKEVARNKVSNRILLFKRNIKHNAAEKFILAAFYKAKTFVRLHKNNLIITDADKGNKTVAMYKTEYLDKMNKLIDDKNTYKAIRSDPTNALQRKNNKIVDELYKGKHINFREKQQLTCTAATAPRLYGLPKIHKLDVPLRPIVSSFMVPCYQLSKYIGEFLKMLISDKYNVKNSFNLKDKLANIRVCDEDMLVSFDVVSLFTNIPTMLASKIVMNKWDQVKQKTNIPKKKFQEILEFCLKDNNYFMFNKKLYSQTFGMPMGNPISPTIAEIIMDNLLDNTISELKQKYNIDIKFIAKYVDDIFAIIKRNDANIILGILNKYHNKLQFTMEIEENSKIPFLDVCIHRENQYLLLDWYSKPTSSGRLINYYSSQPTKYKINTAKNLIHKILTTSHTRFHDANIEKINKILICNNYPAKLIRELINQQIMKNNIHPNTTPNIDTTKTTKKFYSVRIFPT